MALHRRAPPAGQHLQARAYLHLHTADAQRIHLDGRQFQGQRQAVQAPAQVAQRRQILGPQIKPLLIGTRARHEQLHRRTGHRLFDIGRRRRHRQPRHAHHPLARGQQGFAAGDQHTDARRRLAQRTQQLSTRAQQQVGAVEYQQQLARGQAPAQFVETVGRGMQLQYPGEAAEQFARRLHNGHVEPPYAFAITRQCPLGQGQGQCALANAGHAGEGRQALRGQTPRQHAHQFIAPTHRAQTRSQVVLRQQRRQRVLRRRSEAVTALGVIEDPALAVQGATQRGDVHAQVAVFDDAVGPHPLDQGRLAEKVPRRFEEYRENIQGSPAQRYRPARLTDQALLPMKGVGAKAHRRSILHVRHSAETPVLECLRILFPWARRYLASWR